MIKGFMGAMVGATIGGATIHEIGALGLGNLSGTTQSLVGLGVLGNTIKSLKLK